MNDIKTESDRLFKAAVFIITFMLVAIAIGVSVVLFQIIAQRATEPQPVPQRQPFSVNYTVLTDTNATIMYVEVPSLRPEQPPAQCLIIVAPDGRSTSTSCVRN